MGITHNTIRELRESFEDERVMQVLMQYGVSPVAELPKAYIFPTCCHNLDGGSHKLYYYKENRMFKCFTECGALFDLFTLIIKMEELRGHEIGLKEALKIAGVNNYNPTESELYDYSVREQLAYMSVMNNCEAIKEEEFMEYNKEILNLFEYNIEKQQSWVDEGISPAAMKKFGIAYSKIDDAITIPNFDDAGNLIGVRGRFLSASAKAKYMPLQLRDRELFPVAAKNKDYLYMSHATSKNLFGLNKTKESIEKRKVAIIFEGEKSVLKMETFYGIDNISVAVTGKRITQNHVNLLVKYEVQHVILAFDRDYQTIEELELKLKEYSELVAIMKNYFNVSVLMDREMKLGYKDSPIDGGKELFEELMEYRVLL